jgi:hypothetical protein
MRVLLFKADEGEKPTVSEVWERLGELMGDRDYSPLYDPVTGRLWVKVSSDETQAAAKSGDLALSSD